MGQQQLLLLVLGIVIVGLAVASGIDAFEENNRKAALDRATNRAVALAGVAATWKDMPAALGGGQDDPHFDTISLSSLGLTPEITEVNEWGTVGHWADRQSVGIWGVDTERFHVAVYDLAKGIHVAVFLYGPEPECFALRWANWKGSDAPWAGGGTSTWDYLPQQHPERPEGCTWTP
ncbi:MAG: hypothetical protein AAF809_10770 [Bacteroidota bacterium]